MAYVLGEASLVADENQGQVSGLLLIGTVRPDAGRKAEARPAPGIIAAFPPAPKAAEPPGPSRV
jgi:hypothetical protein